MALTDPEKSIVIFIFKRDLEPLGPFAIAEFFDQSKAQQMDQLKTRVQVLRDDVQVKIDTHVVDSAARLAFLNSELSVLDGLITKLT